MSVSLLAGVPPGWGSSAGFLQEHSAHVSSCWVNITIGSRDKYI